MGDAPTLQPLSSEGIQRLRDLIHQVNSHEGAWSMVRGGEGQMPWVETAEPATAAMKWLNDNERMIKFDWPGWDEGRQIFRNWSPATAPSLDHATVCKLLTAVARNDRFNDGAWANLFESGTAQPLLTRLLELEEQLANRH